MFFGIGDSEWPVDIDLGRLSSENRKQTKGAMTNKWQMNRIFFQLKNTL